MKAIVWAAGLGTRLRPVTEHIPKAMAPVFNKPMIENALLSCKKAGIEQVMINLHYFPETIQDHFQDGSALGLKIDYSIEKELLENAGAVINVKDYFENEPFVAIASDNLTDIDIAQMIKTHKQNKALATIATTIAEDVTKYGIVAHDQNGLVTSFQEKPSLAEAKGDQIATCVYVFSPEIFEHMPSEPQKIHFGKHIFPQLIADQKPIFAYKHDGYWNDIGHPANYLLANFDALTKRIKTNIPYPETMPHVYVGKDAYVDPSAKLIAPVAIGARTHIGANSIIGPRVIIGDNCTVDSGCQIERSLLMNNCVVEENSVVWESILSSHTRIYKENQIKNLVLGEHSLVNQTFIPS